ALPSGTDDALGVEQFIVHGEDEDLQGGLDGEDVLQEIDPALIREGDVHDDEVRLQPDDLVERVLRGMRLPADDGTTFLFQQVAQATDHGRVIIHEEDPGLRGTGVTHESSMSIGFSARSGPRGTRITAFTPRPSAVSMERVPPSISMRSRTVRRPRP